MLTDVHLKENTMNTKERIWREALGLFSQRGYEGVSVRDIAAAVGVRESALYRHYQNKQEIYDHILMQYEEHMMHFFMQMQLTGESGAFVEGEYAADLFGNMAEHEIGEAGRQIFHFFFCDDLSAKVRRMLTIEQFKNKQTAQLFRKISFDDALNYQSKIFEQMISRGLFRPADPYIMAVHFVSPIFLMFYKFDADDEGLAQAEVLVVEHIKQFSRIYAP